MVPPTLMMERVCMLHISAGLAVQFCVIVRQAGQCRWIRPAMKSQVFALHFGDDGNIY
jgi:hypothetical protein